MFFFCLVSGADSSSMFRALCHQIWEIVEDRFPEVRHSAIGSFIFLRFFCPAIVTPEAVDLDIPSDSREIRRALLLITKVIQNLANNVKFKEPHMQILNTFLAENIKQVTRFLSDIAVSSFSNVRNDH
jgi:neurofibromin 1